SDIFGKTPLKEALPAEKLEGLWQDLSLRDVKKSSSATRMLVRARKESVPFLRDKLKAPPANADDKRIVKWIAELDDEEFDIREQAFRALDKIGETAVKHLQKARDSGSAEAKKRVEALLKSRGIEDGSITPGQLRLIRVIRILEWSATPEARGI